MHLHPIKYVINKPKKSELEGVAHVAEHNSCDDGEEGGQCTEKARLPHSVIQHVVEIAGDVHGEIDEGEDIAPGVQPDDQNQLVLDDRLN